MAQITNDVVIERVNHEDDFPEFFDCMYQSFGVQTNDAFFALLHPTMHTQEGFATSVNSLREEWRKDGKESTTKIWLKATLPVADGDGESPSRQQRKIVGVAIWIEALQSRNPPSNDVTKTMDPEKMYPDSEPDQRFFRQCYAALYARRVQVVENAGREGRPIMILDLCATHPAYQRRGIARSLVQWGLDYASSQGEKYGGKTLECYTEGSTMGRTLYQRMGFEAEGEVDFVVDEEFKDRKTAPNLQLRRPCGLPV